MVAPTSFHTDVRDRLAARGCPSSELAGLVMCPDPEALLRALDIDWPLDAAASALLREARAFVAAPVTSTPPPPPPGASTLPLLPPMRPLHPRTDEIRACIARIVGVLREHGVTATPSRWLGPGAGTVEDSPTIIIERPEELTTVMDRRPPRLPAAVLWDMDGTLVDTEPYWISTEKKIAAAHGGAWTDQDALELVGSDLLVSGHTIKTKLGLEQSAEEVVEMLLDGVVAQVRRAIPWCDGARDLLLALREAEVPCALVTMSYQRFVEPILEQLPPDTFRVVVTGDMVEQGKPHPEAYLTAAAALGVDAADCVAIEDSPTGARSAEAAGARVLVVPNHVPVPTGAARVFRDSLVGLTPHDLAAL